VLITGPLVAGAPLSAVDRTPARRHVCAARLSGSHVERLQYGQ
jgi:hypothetical protein